MSKEKPITKWCPECGSSQKISGFRWFRCKDCWIAAGKPKPPSIYNPVSKK